MSRFPKNISQADLDEFAQVSGDHNPIHVDPRYAATTAFALPVAHGMYLFSLVVGELQRRWPTMNLEEASLMFPAPTPVCANIRCVITRNEADNEEGGALSVSVAKEDGTEGLRAEVTLSPRAPTDGSPAEPRARTGSGERYGESRTFTRDHQEALARLTGEGPLGDGVPAGLIAGWISKVLGMDLPGAGTNYLKQHLSFHSGARIGEELTVEAQVARVVAEKRLVYLDTVCTGEGGREIASGRALVLARGRLPGSAASEEEGSDRTNTTGAGHHAGGPKGEA